VLRCVGGSDVKEVHTTVRRHCVCERVCVCVGCVFMRDVNEVHTAVYRHDTFGRPSCVKKRRGRGGGFGLREQSEFP
jgi:hypothetical protein